MIWLEPDAVGIAQAAGAIRRGELVIMPTETVYGLAGSAISPDAVAAIFRAKDRPSNNPLIVHIAQRADLDDLVEEVSETAELLIERFWPGPLTLVFRKTGQIPSVVAAGGDTVAVRMPAHPVARALIRASGVPVAAPSANRFMQLSPTRVEHLDPHLLESVSVGLLSEPTQFGIESTVVDVTGSPAVILRPGAISRAQLEEVVPIVERSSNEGARRSPGLHARHYAPKTPARLVFMVMESEPGIVIGPSSNDLQRELPADPTGYAAGLYHALYELDQLGLPEILIQAPPNQPGWEAIWDRLRRATG